jgi:hypothetical protein
MEPTIEQRLDAQDEKLHAIYQSVEKTRKYFLTIIWISIAVVVLPAIGLLFAVPKFLNTYSSLGL